MRRPRATTRRLCVAIPLSFALTFTGASARRPAVDVCALMPLADVASIVAPALTRQKERKAPFLDRQPYMACHYYFPGRPMVTAKLEAPLFESEDNTRASLRNERGMAAAAVSDLSGFGDEAFVHDFPGTSSAIVSLRTGLRRVRGIVRVDEADFPFRLELAKALTAEMLKRLRARGAP
jgi:hypothetical protein